MNMDLETFLVTLYVLVDDWYQQSGEVQEWKERPSKLNSVDVSTKVQSGSTKERKSVERESEHVDEPKPTSEHLVFCEH